MIDQEIVGKQLGEVTFPIERGKLAELARSFQETDAAWWDAEAARQAGFDGIPMPPTITTLVDHWRAGGAIAAAAAIGADLARVLHGEAAWEYFEPIACGDELTASAKVASISQREGKRGGTMTLVEIETDYTNAGGALVARRRDTLIERGAGT